MASEVLVSLYEDFAPEYERTRVPRFRPFVKRLLQYYDTRPGSHVLDAGCGTGLAATMVAPRAGHSGKVLGVDASAAMLEIARHKAHGFGFDQCEFVPGDITRLEAGGESFDVIICSFALWGEPATLFGEFFRVLKPGGALLVQNWEAERGGISKTYIETLRSFVTPAPGERVRGVRETVAKHRAAWSEVDLPADYERALKEAGFHSASAQYFDNTTHFRTLEELIEFHDMGMMARAEIAEMDNAQRAAFHAAVKDTLQPLANEQGIDEHWRAIQVVARK